MRWRTLYRASQGAKCLSRTSNEAVFATSKLLNDKTYDKHFDYKDIVLLKKKSNREVLYEMSSLLLIYDEFKEGTLGFSVGNP